MGHHFNMCYNRLYFLEQFYVLSKMEWKVWRVPIYSLPPPPCFPYCPHPLPESYIFTIDKPTLIHHNHPKSPLRAGDMVPFHRWEHSGSKGPEQRLYIALYLWLERLGLSLMRCIVLWVGYCPHYVERGMRLSVNCHPASEWLSWILIQQVIQIYSSFFHPIFQVSCLPWNRLWKK